MVKIVGAFGCSHAPQILVQPKVSEEYTTQLARVHEALMEVGRRISSLNPDALIVFGSDHMESFFLDNYPQILIFTGDEVQGEMAGHKLVAKGHPELAKKLLFSLVEEGFDVCFSQELELDHPYLAPLTWITKTTNEVKLIPFHINSNVHPRPTARRCYELGKAIRKVLDRDHSDERVVLIATGGLSHYPGTPYYGKVDEEADRYVIEKLTNGRGSELANLDAEWLDEHGEFELRTWITLLGAIGDKPAEIITYQRTYHIGYCVADFKLQ